MSSKINVTTIMNAVTSTGAGSAFQPWTVLKTFQIHGLTSSGTGASVIDIEGSNDDSEYVVLATANLVLSTTRVNESFVSEGPWRYIRANIISISGTGAAVTVNMASEGRV